MTTTEGSSGNAAAVKDDRTGAVSGQAIAEFNSTLSEMVSGTLTELVSRCQKAYAEYLEGVNSLSQGAVDKITQAYSIYGAAVAHGAVPGSAGQECLEAYQKFVKALSQMWSRPELFAALGEVQEMYTIEMNKIVFDPDVSKRDASLLSLKATTLERLRDVCTSQIELASKPVEQALNAYVVALDAAQQDWLKRNKDAGTQLAQKLAEIVADFQDVSKIEALTAKYSGDLNAAWLDAVRAYQAVGGKYVEVISPFMERSGSTQP